MDESDFSDEQIALWELIPGHLDAGLKSENPVGDKITKRVEEVAKLKLPKN